MKHVAKGLAALGRGEDKMLVHMTPGEVAGLQRLALASGGSLTINPHTGLPEAGWLSSLLPMIAGGAATFFSGGTLAPIMAGALAGAGGAAIEGEDPLMGGLMGGLGGWGGAGLAGGIKGLGTEAAKQAATGVSGAASGATNAAGLSADAAANLGASGSQQALANAANQALPTFGMPTAAAPATTAAPATVASAPTGFMNTLKAGYGDLKPGFAELGQRPSAIKEVWSGVPGSDMKGLTTGQKLGVASTGMQSLAAMDSASYGSAPKGSKPYYYHSGPANIDPTTGTTTFEPGYWSKKFDYSNMGTAGGDSEYGTKKSSKSGFSPFAEGGSTGMSDMYDYYKGLMTPQPQAPVDTSATTNYLAGLQEQVRQPQARSVSLPVESELPASTVQPNLSKRQRRQMRNRIPTFGYTGTVGKAGGGIADLEYAAGGKLLRGHGDGVSDDIPAVINGRKGKQKAALADGEFVIPARHVAELGNGSSEAGARALYAMMHRIEKRRKKTDYAKDSGARKDLPA